MGPQYPHENFTGDSGIRKMVILMSLLIDLIMIQTTINYLFLICSCNFHILELNVISVFHFHL